MTNDNLFNKNKIESIEPHIIKVVESELKNSYDEYLKSQEYTDLSNNIKDSEEYINIQESVLTVRNNFEKILDDFKSIFDKNYKPDVVLDWRITNNLAERLEHSYANEIIDNLRWNGSFDKIEGKITKEKILEEFDKTAQKLSAEHILRKISNDKNIITEMTQNTYNELKALLETTAVCNLEDLEHIVRNHFDFDKLIFNITGASIYYNWENN